MLSPNGVQAVLFDLDGTLRHSRPASETVFCDFAGTLGVEDSPEKRRRALRWVHRYWAQSVELLEDIQTFDGKEELFWTNYARRHLIALGCLPDVADSLAPKIHKHMSAEHKPEDWVPEEVPQTLKALQSAGFRLGILSNRTVPCHEYLEKLGLQNYFELALVAGEVSCWKPEPEIFLHALRRMNVSANQTLYVGDNYYADVVGSQRAGLRPVLLDPEGIFPDPGCAVISTLGGLLVLLAEG